MKASIPRLWLLVATVSAAVSFSGVIAQDVILQKDGQRREGEREGTVLVVAD